MKTAGRRGTAPRSQGGEDQREVIRSGKDKAYLRMGSSEGSPAGLGTRSQRGVYTSVYMCSYDCVCVCVCVPKLASPQTPPLAGWREAISLGEGQGLEKEMPPGNYGSIPSLGSCRDQHSTPRPRRPGCLGNPAEKASQWRMKSLWPGIGSHQQGAAGFLQALNIWPGC